MYRYTKCIARTISRRLYSTDVDLKATRHKFRKYGGGRVTLEKNESSGIAVMTLCNSEKKNGLSGKMMSELADYVDELESWDTGRGVILTGDQDTFCSGGDLDTVKQIMYPEAGYIMSTLMHDTTNRLLDLPLVSVALVKGRAIGGGAELCLGCDFRLFTPSSTAAFVQSRMGVSTGWGGGTRLVNLLGPTKALDLLISGRKIDAELALLWGFASAIVNENTSLEETKEWLQNKIGSSPKNVLRAMKTIVRKAQLQSVNDSLSEERKVFKTVWGGTDHQEALVKKPKHR